jgi:hypothetical protein
VSGRTMSLLASLDAPYRIVVEVEGASLRVTAPYQERFVAMMQAIPGRYFDRACRCDVVPLAARERVWEALRACFPGMRATGPRGPFVVACKLPHSIDTEKRNAS